VYMGATDVARQAPNVFRMKLLGAQVIPVTAGAATLKDAMNEALRDWVANVHDTFYIIGTAAGPHPYPELVRDFQSVIGREARAQLLSRTGRLPDLLLCRTEGIIPALEPAHAIAAVTKVAPTMDKDQIIIANLCGRGDKDIFTVADRLGVKL